VTRAAAGAGPSYPPGVVLHIPHHSKVIPPQVREQFLLDPHDLQREMIRMTDHRTLGIFAGRNPAIPVVAAQVSRLVVDVERFLDDGQEPMAALGMGVIYARTSAGSPLRRPLAAAERERLLARHYHPHHKLLLDATDAALRVHGRCLILDGHSFPSAPLPFELDQDPDRAEICIGTDAFHTPPWVEAIFISVFRQAGFTVACNRPFAGALVPLEHYRRESRVASIMVEINRATYLDEGSANPLGSFGRMARRIRRACRAACWMAMRECNQSPHWAAN